MLGILSTSASVSASGRRCGKRKSWRTPEASHSRSLTGWSWLNGSNTAAPTADASRSPKTSTWTTSFPLHKTSGGPHALYNITPACSACNAAKKHRPLLIAWAPPILGGKPRWDKSAPRGKKGNPWVPSTWRDANGPLPSVVEAAQPYPELLRAIQVSEDFYLKKNLSPSELQALETLSSAR